MITLIVMHTLGGGAARSGPSTQSLYSFCHAMGTSLSHLHENLKSESTRGVLIDQNDCTELSLTNTRLLKVHMIFPTVWDFSCCIHNSVALCITTADGRACQVSKASMLTCLAFCGNCFAFCVAWGAAFFTPFTACLVVPAVPKRFSYFPLERSKLDILSSTLSHIYRLC